MKTKVRPIYLKGDVNGNVAGSQIDKTTNKFFPPKTGFHQSCQESGFHMITSNPICHSKTLINECTICKNPLY